MAMGGAHWLRLDLIAKHWQPFRPKQSTICRTLSVPLSSLYHVFGTTICSSTTANFRTTFFASCAAQRADSGMSRFSIYLSLPSCSSRSCRHHFLSRDKFSQWVRHPTHLLSLPLLHCSLLIALCTALSYTTLPLFSPSVSNSRTWFSSRWRHFVRALPRCLSVCLLSLQWLLRFMTC